MLVSIVLPAPDLDSSKAMLSAVLGEPHTDTPYYVGFNSDGLEIGLDPNGADNGLAGATPVLRVDDIQAALAAMTAAGGDVTRPATEVGGGLTVAMVSLGNGVTLGVGQVAG